MFPIHRSSQPRIAIVAAARPNFMKVGPVVRALEPHCEVRLIHTGQHYDDHMYRTFFKELDLPAPSVDLGVGSGSHAAQTAGALVALEDELNRWRPAVVVVVGDVNSTLAAALAATKLQIPVAHVEAGLRSHDWSMPEEINRVLTDRVSRWLLTPSSDADHNLRNEGVPEDWIHLVGNVMIDTLLANIDHARERASRCRRHFDLGDQYGVITLHRPSNVDESDVLGALLEAASAIDPDLPVLFPAHPRTRERIHEFGTRVPSNMRLVEPLGYLDFIGLVDGASIVLTDSGGVQEETSVLGIPCLTLRENTERPITVELGTNHVVGLDREVIVNAGRDAMGNRRQPADIHLWDGSAGQRAAAVLLADLRA